MCEQIGYDGIKGEILTSVCLVLSLFCPDAEILPGPEEKHALHVAHRQEVACQAVPLPGRSPQRAAEDLPPLEGRSPINRASSVLAAVPITPSDIV